VPSYAFLYLLGRRRCTPATRLCLCSPCSSQRCPAFTRSAYSGGGLCCSRLLGGAGLGCQLNMTAGPPPLHFCSTHAAFLLCSWHVINWVTADFPLSIAAGRVSVLLRQGQRSMASIATACLEIDNPHGPAVRAGRCGSGGVRTLTCLLSTRMAAWRRCGWDGRRGRRGVLPGCLCLHCVGM
jgi:hypothetical protein